IGTDEQPATRADARGLRYRPDGRTARAVATEPIGCWPAGAGDRPGAQRLHPEIAGNTELDEAYIFPAVKTAGGPAGGYADVLKAQHHRGREGTEYTLALTGNGAIGSGDAESSRTRHGELRSYQTMPRARTRSFSRPDERAVQGTDCRWRRAGAGPALP